MLYMNTSIRIESLQIIRGKNIAVFKAPLVRIKKFLRGP